MYKRQGLGWDLEAFAIHKGTKKLAAAQKLADWASSKDAMILYGKNFAITAQPGVAAPLPNVPKDYEARLVKMLSLIHISLAPAVPGACLCWM